ncbi:MAG: hypothetical protein WCQ67_01120 [Treponema sp.]
MNNSTKLNNSSDDQLAQVLMPKDVYVGDTAQIQFFFRSAIDFFSVADLSSVNDETIALDFSQKAFEDKKNFCTISSLTLTRNKLNYILTMTFVPWKTGVLDFSAFDLYEAVNKERFNSENLLLDNKEVAKFFIDLRPVKIASLSESLGTTTLKPPASPISVPGTNYTVWSFIIASLIVVILIVLFILKLPKIIKKYYELRENAGFLRNAKSTKKQLRSLLKNTKIMDSEFSNKWQKIIKNYLEYRFEVDFHSTPSPQISNKIRSATGNMLSGNQQCVVEKISALFSRTDYVKYANGSIDSQLLPSQSHQAQFLLNERKNIITETENIINAFESENADLEEMNEMKMEETSK